MTTWTSSMSPIRSIIVGIAVSPCSTPMIHHVNSGCYRGLSYNYSGDWMEGVTLSCVRSFPKLLPVQSSPRLSRVFNEGCVCEKGLKVLFDGSEHVHHESIQNSDDQQQSLARHPCSESLRYSETHHIRHNFTKLNVLDRLSSVATIVRAQL